MVATVAVAIVASGCETVGGKAHEQYEESATEVRKWKDSEQYPVVADEVVDYPWIGNKVVPRKENLPLWFSKKQSWVTQEPKSLWGIADRVSMVTNVPVIVEADVLAVARPESGASEVMEVSTHRIRYNETSSASEFLDTVVGRFGLSWRFDSGSVVISRREPRVYTIPVLQGKESFTANIGGGSGAKDQEVQGSVETEQQTSLTQEIRYEGEHDRWQSVVDAVKGLMSPIGELTESKTLGQIVVNDTPYAQRAIDAYIDRATWSLTRQIHIDIKVLAVTVDESTQFGIDWNLLYETGDISTTFQSINNAQGAPNLLGAILTDPTSRFVNSQMVVNALSKKTELSIVTQAAAKTLNNKPTPLTSTNTAGYLKELTTTQSLEFVTQGLKAGSITTGTSVTVYPRILDDGRMVIRFDGALSQLLPFTEIETANGDRISIPNFDARAFNDEIVIRSGGIAVLNVFSQNRGEQTGAGTGHSDNFLMGAKDNSMTRTDIVVLIQPRIIGEAGVRNS